MAKGINRFYGIGNLGNAPEIKATNTGTNITNFSIAISETFKDSNGVRQERTEWVNIVTFGRLAEICGQYLTKGSKVYVEGKLRTRKWQDKNGVDRYTTEIVANEMQMLDGREPQQNTVATPKNNAWAQPQPNHQFDEEIPF